MLRAFYFNKFKVLFCTTLMFMVISSIGWAATYYVSNNGNDGNAGTSSSAPWKTVSKVNSRSFSPGDKILFERGGSWNEQLKPSSSGSDAGGYITYGAYGSGNKPKFNGSGIGNLIYDGSGRDYLIFENLDVGFATSAGFYNVNGSTYWYIQDCSIHDVGSLSSESGTGFLNAGSYITVRRNKFYNNGRHGISIWNASSSVQTNILYEFNDIYNFNHTGIDIQAADGSSGNMNNITIRYNKIHEVDAWGAPGMYVNGTTSSTVANLRIYGNVIYNLNGSGDDRGIVLDVYSSPVYIYNNTLYNISNQAIALRNGSGTVYVYNNIGMNSGSYNLRVDSSTNKHIDYNCWNQGSGFASTIANVNGANYSNWASYKSATGFDAHSKWGNPGFTSTSAQDFSLNTSSICIDAGMDLGDSYADALSGDSIWPDGVMLLKQSLYGIWDIGAFVFGSGAQGPSQPGADTVPPNAPTGLTVRVIM